MMTGDDDWARRVAELLSRHDVVINVPREDIVEVTVRET